MFHLNLSVKVLFRNMSVLNTSQLCIVEKIIHTPPAEEIICLISNGLKTNFKNVEVNLIDCPNLSCEPYNLAGSGFGGCCPTLIEIGGPAYLFPSVDCSKLYNLKEVCSRICCKDKYFAVGAGGGPWPHLNKNCEGIYNFKVKNNCLTNKSYLAFVNKNEQYEVQKFPTNLTTIAYHGNAFLTEGKPGKVINVKCSQRTGEENLISCIRKTLAEFYNEETVGLGGMFILKKGKAQHHVMRDFSQTPLNSDEDVNAWLKLFDMDAPLTVVGTMVTNEACLDLRLQHFHSFSNHGQAGHFNNDITPDTAEYEGFFVIAERVAVVDQPTTTVDFGKD